MSKKDRIASQQTNVSPFSQIRAGLKRFADPRFSASYVAKMAILTALAFILYAFVKFNLPIFPSFLDIQISELPALLAGFSMGPVSGCLVVVLKCLFKFPLSSTAYVGEATDMLLGVAFVLPASLIYRLRRDKQSHKAGMIYASVGLAAGSLLVSFIAVLVNRYISVPFYVQLYFNGNFEGIVGVVSALYKDVTADTFYRYYLWAGVLPFNILRCLIVSALTFVLYKRLSVLLHWDGASLRKKPESVFGAHIVKKERDTYALAARLADELDGGEIILLSGDLGAGKTTFTKGLAKALGVTEEVTSPTFAILNVYNSGRLKLNHLDMYRIENEDEMAELGVQDSIDSDSVTVIEWNKLTELDGKVFEIDITLNEDGTRTFDISKRGEPSEEEISENICAPNEEETLSKEPKEEPLEETSKEHSEETLEKALDEREGAEDENAASRDLPEPASEDTDART